VVDQLATEYAGLPVVFLEDDVDTAYGRRRDRWWAGYGGSGGVYLPLVMVSSGHLVSNGPVSYAAVYRDMVDSELERPPRAEVEAYAARSGSLMRVWLRAVNRSTVTLSAANGAAAQALVWEERKMHVTARTVRAAPYVDITAVLPPGAAFTAVLDTLLPSGVDWSKTHVVALLEYRPAGAAGAFDMMQAALALPPQLAVSPETLDVRTPELAPDGTVGTVALSGPHVLTFAVSSSAPWLSATPGTGAVPAAVTVRVAREALPFGVHEGVLTFSASGPDGLAFTRTVTVRVDAPDLDKRVRRRSLIRG
jgi:hypothetical protein